MQLGGICRTRSMWLFSKIFCNHCALLSAGKFRHLVLQKFAISSCSLFQEILCGVIKFTNTQHVSKTKIHATMRHRNVICNYFEDVSSRVEGRLKRTWRKNKQIGKLTNRTIGSKKKKRFSSSIFEEKMMKLWVASEIGWSEWENLICKKLFALWISPG